MTEQATIDVAEAFRDRHTALTAGVSGYGPEANQKRLEGALRLRSQYEAQAERAYADAAGSMIDPDPKPPFALYELIQAGGDVREVVARDDFNDMVARDMGAMPREVVVSDEDGARWELQEPHEDEIREAAEEAGRLRVSVDAPVPQADPMAAVRAVANPSVPQSDSGGPGHAPAVVDGQIVPPTRRWYNQGREGGAEFMLIVHDGPEGDIGPRFVGDGESTRDAIGDVLAAGGQVREVYDLKLDFLPQFMNDSTWNTEDGRAIDDEARPRIRQWFDRGLEMDAEFMLVVSGGRSKRETAPSYVGSEFRTKEIIDSTRAAGEQVRAVYDLRAPFLPQLMAGTPWNTEEDRYRPDFGDAVTFRVGTRSYVFDPNLSGARVDRLTDHALLDAYNGNKDEFGPWTEASEVAAVKASMREAVAAAVTEEVRAAHPEAVGAGASATEGGRILLVYPIDRGRELYEAGIPSPGLIENAFERADLFNRAPAALHEMRERRASPVMAPAEPGMAVEARGFSSTAGTAPRIRHSVTGNLVADPELRTRREGERALVTFRLAETPRVFDREAQAWKDGQTTYYDVAMNDSAHARNVLATLKGGMRADVVGDYDAKPYVNKKGQSGVNYRIVAEKASPSLEFATAVVTKNSPRQTREPFQGLTQQHAGIDEPWGPGL